MKTSKFTLAVLLMTSIAITAFAQSSAAANNTIDWQKAEKNYLKALGSENLGVRQSAATYVGEYRLKGAVQPLITILQTDKVENSRMTAALALVHIGEKEGIKAVEDASLYDGSEKVARFCEQLLKASLHSQELSLK